MLWAISTLISSNQKPVIFRIILSSIQSYSFSPVIDKPTRVHNNSATLIDNILVNRIDFKLSSGNTVSDISDVIYQTRETVFHRDIQTAGRELKIRRAAEYF